MNRMFLLFLATVMFFVGCQKKDEEMEKPPEKITLSEKVEIINPWLRPSAKGTNTALFFKLFNNTGKADTLYGAESKLAEVVEVHETYKTENDMMGMRHIDYVVIPVGDTVVFKPRDLHIMIIKLHNDILIGDSGEVLMKFRNSGDVEIKAPVRDMPMM